MFAASHSSAALKPFDPIRTLVRIVEDSTQHAGKVFARVTEPGSEALKWRLWRSEAEGAAGPEGKINEEVHREVAALRRSVTQWSGTRRAEEGD